MSTQPPPDLSEVAKEISVREVPFGSRQVKRGYAEPTGNYRVSKTTGQPVRLVTTKIKKDEILRLLLINKTTKEIADDLRLSVSTVRDYIRDEDFQKELRANSETIWRRVDEELLLSKLNKTQRIAEMGDRALDVLAKLLDSNDERVQAKVASDLLDRNAETSKHHHIESKNVTFNMSAEDLIHAAQAAAEIERTAGNQVPTSPITPSVSSKDIEGVREGLDDGA